MANQNNHTKIIEFRQNMTTFAAPMNGDFAAAIHVQTLEQIK